jgi:hypothetical protein
MYDFLINHAIKNVWCTPNQDDQVVFAPARISVARGATGTVPVLWETLNLPDTTSVYHVFQVGQVSPGLLDLLPTAGVWTLVAQHMKDRQLFADVYTIDGIQLPRIETYILVNWDKNVLIAIKDQQPLVDLSQEQLFLRLYSNAYFDSARYTNVNGNPPIDIYGARITGINQALQLQRQMQALQAQPGLVSAYQNGMLVDAFNPFTVTIGQVVEFVYDASVEKVITIPVQSLQTFTSLLDLKEKFLIHYAGTDDGTIDYLKDIDFYLVNTDQPGPVPTFRGVYYHKNNPDAVRQLTHRDYSICVPYVFGYASSTVSGWGGLVNNLSVRMHIRHSGYQRSLISDVNRILDLYKLPDLNIVEAMLGTNATIANWRAENLENSPYTALMGVPNSSQITIDQVQAAYGYGTISRALGDGPMMVQNAGGVNFVDVPFGLQNGATMFEYDNTGLLLGFYYSPIGYVYQCANPTCAWVQGIAGQGQAQTDTTHSVQTQVLTAGIDYRYYVSPIQNNAPTTWQDVTGDNSKYTVTNGVATWSVDMTQLATMVKSDAGFLAYTYQMTPADGLFIFDVTSTDQWNGTYINGPVFVPPANLDIYLNGRILVNGLDYFVEWPEICIVNTAYLIYNSDGSLAQQTVTIVASGFCDSDLTVTPYQDVGFVSYGEISRNGFYNARDDKVLRIGVNGGVFPRALLEFSEDNPTGPMTIVPNGSPYLVEQVIVPTRGNTDQDTYTLLALDQPNDQAVQLYLSQYLKDATETGPDEIPQLYAVYSPFCAKIIYDMLSGAISMTPYQGQYSDMTVKTALQGYSYLLAYEPTYMGLDPNHVIVYPHNRNTVITLNIYQWMFLQKAVSVFLNDKVDTSHFVDILSTYV